jgi:hypothetical protein
MARAGHCNRHAPRDRQRANVSCLSGVPQLVRGGCSERQSLTAIASCPITTEEVHQNCRLRCDRCSDHALQPVGGDAIHVKPFNMLFCDAWTLLEVEPHFDLRVVRAELDDECSPH